MRKLSLSTTSPKNTPAHIRRLCRVFLALAAALMVWAAPGQPTLANKAKAKKKQTPPKSRPIKLKTKGAFIGDEVPNFKLKTLDGKRVQLRQFRGKYVVIEWFNDACPAVKKYYKQKVIQKIQAHAHKKKVVWLTIVVGIQHKEGQINRQTLEKLKQRLPTYKATTTHVLLDPKGKTAAQMLARHVSQIQIICPKGTLLYSGAVRDDKRPKDKDYITDAIDHCTEKKQILNPLTVANGCPIIPFKTPK